MSDTPAVVAAALAGAVVGGAATGVGSYFVGRTERRHGARVNLYLDLLPDLRRAPAVQRRGNGEPSRTSIASDIVRIANVAGGRAIRLAKAVDTAVDGRDRPFTQDEADAAPSVGAGSLKRIDRSAEQEALDRAIANLDAWLERKVRGGVAALLP